MHGILFRRSEDGHNYKLHGVIDADWTGDTDTRRSTAGALWGYKNLSLFLPSSSLLS